MAANQKIRTANTYDTDRHLNRIIQNEENHSLEKIEIQNKKYIMYFTKKEDSK